MTTNHGPPTPQPHLEPATVRLLKNGERCAIEIIVETTLRDVKALQVCAIAMLQAAGSAVSEVERMDPAQLAAEHAKIPMSPKKDKAATSASSSPALPTP
jgi:hypothetical protein